MRNLFLLAVALVSVGLGMTAPTAAQPFRTNEPFPRLNYDHPFVHSSTHLQGVRAPVKWAGGLIYMPPSSTGFQGMTSVVVVDNPDPVRTMNATVDFFDSVGTPAGSVALVIPPEGFATAAPTGLAGTFGFGTARVSLAPDCPPLVGATVHNTIAIAGIADQDRPLSIYGRPPGASALQQLQEVQADATKLWFGPMPLTLGTGAPDFDDGNLPFIHVVNPNAQPNTISLNLTFFDRNTGTVTGPTAWRTVTLPPFGTLTEINGPHLAALGTFNNSLWNASMSFLSAGADYDMLVDVTSLDDLPILGDGYLVDLLGPTGAGSRFRMVSAMMVNAPSAELSTPDFSLQSGGIIQTTMGVMNVGTADAGPLTVQYFDASAKLVATSGLASLPAGHSLRIDPNLAGYPMGTVGFGSAQVSSNDPDAQLVGLTKREILPMGIYQYHKAYGETLLHLTGSEPGPGWTDLMSGMTRKASPLVRADPTDPTFPWPGYTTFGNFATSDIGTYGWSFWNAGGGFCGQTWFSGLPPLFTSWTYEDPLVTCPGPVNLSGRVDHSFERIEGINVIGDPLDEFLISGLADDPPGAPPFGGPGGYYPPPPPGGGPGYPVSPPAYHRPGAWLYED